MKWFSFLHDECNKKYSALYKDRNNLYTRYMRARSECQDWQSKYFKADELAKKLYNKCKCYKKEQASDTKTIRVHMPDPQKETS